MVIFERGSEMNQSNHSIDTHQVQIVRATVDLIPSFHLCLDTVARERIFIEMIEAPPLEKVSKFQTELIHSGGPIAYAIANGEVIGWCDIFPMSNPRQSHRGCLGMGLRKDFRGRGLGSKLLEHTMDQAKSFGLEKIELYVYTSNSAAIALYERYGFEREGLLRKYRKLDGQNFDCLAMAKFI